MVSNSKRGLYKINVLILFSDYVQVTLHQFFLMYSFFKNNCIYLFLAALGLCCCTRAFSS